MGGYGITSDFGDLTGLSLETVDQFLRSFNPTILRSQSGEYLTYKFPDLSSLTIRLRDGRVSRLPAPCYGSDGQNLHKGLRLGKDGSLLRTRDAQGNPIPRTHIPQFQGRE